MVNISFPRIKEIQVIVSHSGPVSSSVKLRSCRLADPYSSLDP